MRAIIRTRNRKERVHRAVELQNGRLWHSNCGFDFYAQEVAVLMKEGSLGAEMGHSIQITHLCGNCFRDARTRARIMVYP